MTESAYLRNLRRIAFVVLAALAATGCRGIYYNTMEKFGLHKRDLLVRNVGEARDSQQEAREQFASALEQFSAVMNFEGGSLEEKYEKLKAELERSEAQAAEVSERIDEVERVAGDLFAEWEDELDDYANRDLRRQSEQNLRRTRAQYERLIAAMHRAEAKIEPVLTPLRDQVLFLKHNLNAQAIASLQGELASVEADVEALLREMEAAIAEADLFIREMKLD